jgi:hypothetical protein
VIELVERLSEAVGGHLEAREVVEGDVTGLVLLLDVLEVVVNVLSTLMVAVLADHVKSGLVVGVQLNWHEILTLVANLGK